MNLFEYIKGFFFRKVDSVYVQKNSLLPYKYVIHTSVELVEKNGVHHPDKTRNHIRVYQLDHDNTVAFEHGFLHTVVLGEDNQKKTNAISRLFKLKRWKAHEGGDIDPTSILYTDMPIDKFFELHKYIFIPCDE